MHKIKSSWVNKLAFDSYIDKHLLRMDTNGTLSDDTGPSPKKLLLSSLAGCTGMDVVSLLNKMRVPFTGLDIEVEADLTDEHPIVYSEIRLVYKIFGDDLDHDKVEKAVRLSQERYCGVSAMLRKNSPITYRIEYVGELV
ncbi:OsmC family protein [Fulvivirgaceae bacterium BMA10]|uniref:OsmC family protein n=1 Tax=Splendidivirga corallicola TaxID=3051826 RepID=A0ABT8KL58_9BACT|nr:OsmC family protein [Fulvivirgaceae bacterium BMA10]